MDFNCPNCGEHSHFDGMFIYAVKCDACGKVYRMPTEVPMVEIGPDDEDYERAWVDTTTPG